MTVPALVGLNPFRVLPTGRADVLFHQFHLFHSVFLQMLELSLAYTHGYQLLGSVKSAVAGI